MAAIVVLGSLLLSGCTLDQSGPPATQVSDWISTSAAGAAIGQVQVDSRNIGLALSRHDPPSAIKTVCALLTTDAQTAIGNLPSPDTTLTDDLNTAYEEAAAAGTDCYNGASGGSLLRRSAAERKKIAPLLSVAVDRVATITGHTPSTSTTMASGAGDDPFGN
jgi:outer membrane murein-binding lipoprotein Lpp